MSESVTEQLRQRYRGVKEESDSALAEVLCSAYKDATGAYPNDRLREAIYDAIQFNT